MLSDPYTEEEIKELFPQGANKDILARLYGLRVFDVAIPQSMFDRLAEDEFDPWKHYVFDYSTSSMGILFPLTKEGHDQAVKVGLL